MWTKTKDIELFTGILYGPVRRFSSYPTKGDSFSEVIRDILDNALSKTTEFCKPELIQIDKYVRTTWL